MRKKLFCAMLSISVLLSSTVAYASEPVEVRADEPVSAQEELPKLEAPSNARWDTQTGCLFFDASSNGTGRYCYSIYTEGNDTPVFSEGASFFPGDTELKMNLDESALEKMETGKYYFTVYAEGNDTYSDSEVCKSDILDYIRPEKRVSVPADLKWNKTTAVWTLGDTSVVKYELECKEEGSDEWKNIMNGSYPRVFTEKVEERDFAPLMDKKGLYRFRVRALSNNIFEAVDNEWSEWSPEISTEELTSAIAQEIKELLENNADADEILSFLEKKDTKDLAVSIQTESEIRDAMAQAEKQFSEEKGISVKTDVSSDMADKISGEISVLGAAFNAGADATSVTLSLTKPAAEKEVDSKLYENAVQVSITLDGAADEENLKVPVRITMPIPSGVKPEKLWILHYHSDGTSEAICPDVSENMVSFTLTSFSTFVFVNEAAEEEQPSGDLPFTDVKPGWQYEPIKFVYEKGIMTGFDKDNFQPNGFLTRAQFASVIYRLAGSPETAYKDIFSDVPAGKWYSDAILWAYDSKIVAGLGGGLYGVYENITREQMARMLMEFARVQGYDTSVRADLEQFADASQVSKWALDNMQWAVGSGIISGSVTDGKYYMNPKGNATRAECAVMLMKFIQKYEQ